MKHTHTNKSPHCTHSLGGWSHWVPEQTRGAWCWRCYSYTRGLGCHTAGPEPPVGFNSSSCSLFPTCDDVGWTMGWDIATGILFLALSPTQIVWGLNQDKGPRSGGGLRGHCGSSFHWNNLEGQNHPERWSSISFPCWLLFVSLAFIWVRSFHVSDQATMLRIIKYDVQTKWQMWICTH